MSNISELQTELFATLKALRDPANPLPIEVAKAVTEVAQVIINSAKAEVEFLKVTNKGHSQFFGSQHTPALPDGTHQTATGTVNVQQINGGRVVTHKLK